MVGTSAGGLVAALYASGKNGAVAADGRDHGTEATFTDWTLPIFSRGVLRGEALARWGVGTQVGGRPIQDMSLPLGIVATDLQSSQGVLFRQWRHRHGAGVQCRAVGVPANCGFPGAIFVDGGLVAPKCRCVLRARWAPSWCWRSTSQSPPEANAPEGSLQILLQTFAIIGQDHQRLRVARRRCRAAPGAQRCRQRGFRVARKRSIAAGRQAMQQACRD